MIWSLMIIAENVYGKQINIYGLNAGFILLVCLNWEFIELN